jgi:O-antigen ligase
MNIKNIIKEDNLQWCLTALVLLTTSVFFIAQPFERHIVINAATILWILGLGFLPIAIKNSSIRKQELKIYILGAVCFFISLASWLNSPYFNATVKPIEPDGRFLLFPLTVIAIQYSKLTFRHMALALFLGGMAYTWIAFDSTHVRVQGDENAVTFGNGAMLLFVLSTCLLFFEKHKVVKFLLILAAIGYLYASYRSGTRGSFLVFIPLSLMSIYFLNKKQSLILILVLLCAGAIFSQSNIAKRLVVSYNNVNSYIEHKNSATSAGQRFDMWQAAWCFNQENPLLGKGPHQFGQATIDPERVCEITPRNGKGYNVQAHSFYFNAIATIGWLGLTSMLLFFFAVAYYAWSLPLIARVTIPAIILTFLTYSLTVDLLFQRYMADKHLTLLAILLGLSLNYKKYLEDKDKLD